MIPELSPEKLRKTYDPKALGIAHTGELKPLVGIIGQKRAVSALQFGLGIEGKGFNIYVAGPPGIGKMTAVKTFLEELAATRPVPPDWCYVNNFDEPGKPKAIQLPAGRGRRFALDMKFLIDHLRREIPKAFEGEKYAAGREEVVKKVDKDRSALLQELDQKVFKAGFGIQPNPAGFLIIPMVGGKPMKDEEFAALPPPEREALTKKQEELQEEVKGVMKKIRDLERTAQEKLSKLDQEVALFIVGGFVGDLLERYADSPEVLDYLKAVQKNVLENIEAFKPPPPPRPGQEELLPPGFMDGVPFRKYEVNLLVDNSRQKGAPVVLEFNPNYANLFGRVEKESRFGTLYTDFTLIKSGSFHRANGGYLVLPVEDVLRNAFSWDGIKRALRGGEIEIEEIGERLGFAAAKSMRPQPIPLELKVVFVGQPLWYYLLHTYEEEFTELVKVRADFDTKIEAAKETVEEFLSFFCALCHKEKLKHLEAGAAAKLLEHSARLAEDQKKLSTNFGRLTDLIREANFWAQKGKNSHITAAHVEKALEEKVYRSSLIQEKLQEMTVRGTLLIDTAGEAVGQANGLSVLQLGDYAFGKPSRITASVAPGRGGILDIEREVQLGGPIHSKGVMILSGYLAQKYAQDKPLTLSARLVFEQSYEGIEGDSASSTELYAILSALSGLPIKQGIAVTGSVNQKGKVQAIGGVNEKIEGHYELCRAKGLNGNQGAMIPASNIENLMLKDEVLQAVKAKKFRIWGVKTVEEGIEILTGIPAGKRGKDGKYPEGTVNFLLEKRLKEFGKSLKEMPPPKENDEKRPAVMEAKKEPPKPIKTPIKAKERRRPSKTKRKKK
ncbi:MAG TPA: ATP-binding protein [candidate division Zixibacteria bacterium]|nr:ATP-binding protein [candidate division Zixibacteria bacterium]